jgi:hypothetical protein
MMQTQTTNTLVVELVNLQYCDFASRGTPCYQAKVRIDGVDAGMVRNDGQGGASLYIPAELRDRVDEIARKEPPLDLGDQLVDMDGDTFLAVLVYRTLDMPNALDPAPESLTTNHPLGQSQRGRLQLQPESNQTAANTITRYGETLKDDAGRLVGWIADDGSFHPCGASLSADQMRAILAMLAK